MSVGSFVILLASLSAVQPPAGPPASTAAPSPADEQTLKAANLAVTGPALLDFLHKRTAAPADKAQIAALVKQLGDPAQAAHDPAAGQLTALGEAAVPFLREAANNLDDPDFARRARQCLQNIEGAQGAGLTTAVVRALAAVKPDGTAEALLDYLPYAEDEKVEQGIEDALATVAFRDGKPESAIVRALTDNTPIRRSVAAAVLCRVGGLEQLAAVRVLLKDPKPTVRFRVATALSDAYSADAIPVLIDLLSELPNEQRKEDEAYLTKLAGEWAVAGPTGNDATSRHLRREAWNAWWHGIDDKVLLDEFKTRTMSDDERDRALALIQKLDDVSADVRQKASADLVAMGLPVTPLLRQATSNPNPRIGPFALKCLQLIENGSPNPLPAAAGRMLALRAPDGAVETLLAYLPYADNDESEQQLRDLLSSLAVHDAEAVPVLVKALNDKIGVRRGAAAVALCKRGAGDELPAVKKLFKDADPDVRLRAALAVLTLARDKDAVPVLIGVLADLPADRVWEPEEMLTFLAGDKGPSVSVAGDAAARKKAADAWARWWADNSAAVDLAKLDFNEKRELGYLLVVENQSFVAGKGGRVVEFDAAGRQRWEIDNLLGPMDAQAFGGNRVVLIDNNGNRVCERETTGDKKIIWEANVPQAFRVQRLPNGNTFVACHNVLMEVDRTGKEVNRLPLPAEWLFDAVRLRDGQTALFNNQGFYSRLDASGKEVKKVHAPFNFATGMNAAEVLPNDHVIIASWSTSKVFEYDADGKTTMEADIPQATGFFRLSNGHTLVACQNQGRVVELDPAGKVVREMKDLKCHPYRVSRR